MSSVSVPNAVNRTNRIEPRRNRATIKKTKTPIQLINGSIGNAKAQPRFLIPASTTSPKVALQRRRRYGSAAQYTCSLTEGDAEVAEGAAGDGHVDGEFGVAEGGEQRAEPRNGVGHDEPWPRVEPRGAARGDEHPGADHAAEPQPDEVPPPQSARHPGARPRPHAAHLLVRRRGRARAPRQPTRRLRQRPPVRAQPRERRRRAAARGTDVVGALGHQRGLVHGGGRRLLRDSGSGRDGRDHGTGGGEDSGEWKDKDWRPRAVFK